MPTPKGSKKLPPYLLRVRNDIVNMAWEKYRAETTMIELGAILKMEVQTLYRIIKGRAKI